MKIPLHPAVAAGLLGLAPCVSAQVQLLTWWSFDSPAPNNTMIDARSGVAAVIRNGATQTDPGEGRSGAGTDRAMRFGGGPQNVYVPDASFFNMAADGDAVTVSFWQKLNAITSPFTVFFTSPSSSGGGRGFSGHMPWSNNIVYFDSAGCCDPPQRISDVAYDQDGNPINWVGEWRHVVLLKNGDLKEVYIDGQPGPMGFDAAPLPLDFTDLYIGNGPGLGNGVNGLIDDVAVFIGALDTTQIAALAGGASPGSIGAPADSDADGLPDLYEFRFFPGDLTKLSAAGDFDSDGLTDGAEFAAGTNPTLADTDGDGLADGVETSTGVWVSAANTGTNPLLGDTDGDGLLDGVETNTGAYTSPTNTGTNPLIADTDGDGFNDGVEVLYGGSNPLNPASRPLRAAQLDLLAYWSFDDATNPAQTVDLVRGYVGDLLVGNDLTETMFTADGGGKSGQPGDRAVDFGAMGGNATGISVAAGGFLNLAASQNQVAISFWQNLYAVTASTSFKGLSPSSSGEQRGLSGHATWDNNRFYWDTAGCCDGFTQRIDEDKDINGPLDLVGTWHHFVFQKNGDVKEIWVNGQLLKSGTNTGPLPLDFNSLQIGRNQGAENIAGLIDDFAVYADALTPAEIALLFAGTPPNSPLLVPPNTDTDGDGMPDAYEIAHGLNPNVDDRLGDLDSDGMTNFDEFLAGTHPNNPDTDGDSLRDGVETNTGVWVSATNTGTNPLRADSDGDGLADNVETNTGTFVSAANTGTNPNLADTDGDGYDDGLEIKFGSNPTLASSVPNIYYWWSFNDASQPESSSDLINDVEVQLLNGAIFTDDGGGRTGQPGDRALDLGFFKEGQMAKATDAQWLNDAASGDRIAFAYWQYLEAVSDSSGFWASSPSSSAGQRGAQAHSTWSNNRFYWDTAGCCDPPQRLDQDKDAQGLVDLVGSWHHFVFQKIGPTKEIWVNGTLLTTSGGAAPLPRDFNELTIGAEPTGANNTLGRIDDFAIFGAPLTPEQIGRLAAGETPSDILGGTPSTSGIQFTQITYNAAANQVTLTWTSQPGRSYTLESSTTLGTWPVELNDNIPSGGATTSFTHNLATFPGGIPTALYYRARQN